MGSCTSCSLNKVGDLGDDHDQVGDDHDESSLSDLYVERVTHIVADIHERVRHHQPETVDRGVPDINTGENSLNDASLCLSSSSNLSSNNSHKKSNLSLPTSGSAASSLPHLLP